tara:strand:+ start:841 stop:1602 length:762 start_codon:yes stop_codon:yes gene_type:complete
MKVKYFDLENKKVFITGGGSGIGASIVEHFCEQRSEVYFVDINDDESNKLINLIDKKKFKIPKYFNCDLTDIGKLQSVISKINSEKGSIDVVVNNAANDQRHTTDEVDEEYWDNRMAVNLKHFFFTIKAVKDGMIKKGCGSIVNLGSISWMMGEGDKVGYETAKSAIVGLTRSFARELGPYNIRSNSIIPGSIATERQIKNWLTPKYKKSILEKQCLKRQLKPEDVASMVLYLSSDVSSGCTKQNFIVDAGLV